MFTKKVIVKGRQDVVYRKRKFKNMVRRNNWYINYIFSHMNAYGMLPMAIIKTKTESLCFYKNLIYQCKNVTSVDMAMKKWSNIKDQFLLCSRKHSTTDF